MRIRLVNTVLLAIALLFSRELMPAAGDLDPTFGVSGIVITPFVETSQIKAIALQADRKIVATGPIGNNAGVARYTTNGALDTTFNGTGIVITPFPAPGGSIQPNAIAVQADGKIVVGGRGFDGAILSFLLIRYNTDGTLDLSFNGTGFAFVPIGDQSECSSIAIQTDGKIVAGGIALDGGVFSSTVARYNTNGTLDPSFNGTGFAITPIGSGESSIAAIAIQTDGKIVAGGIAQNGGVFSFAVERYKTDGTLDLSFNGTGFVITTIGIQSFINSIAIQTDGKIVAGGFSDDGIINRQFTLARYTAQGSLDGSFNGTGIVITPIETESTINSVVLQPDGKIVAGGFSTDVDNVSRFALARYTTAGLLDTSFGAAGTGIVTTAIGSVAQINSLALQTDGKIVAGGSAFDSGAFALARYFGTVVPVVVNTISCISQAIIDKYCAI